MGIVGRPNVGKSTLLNQILGEKLAIASPRPQTTRTRLLGVKNLPGAQLALLDTPGLHRPGGVGRSVLNRYMIDEALGALGEVDVVLVVTDLRSLRSPGTETHDKTDHRDLSAHQDRRDPAEQAGTGPAAAAPMSLDQADAFVADRLRAAGKPAILAINKVDLLRDKLLLLPLIEQWGRLHEFRAIVPISARSGDGVEGLVAELCGLLPQGPALFPADMLTDRAERFLVAELIREQVFLATHQEVPYSVAVTVDNWEDRLGGRGRGRSQGPGQGQRIGAYIDATIHVEKEAQKKIVVGEAGRMIRDVGSAARVEVGKLLGCPVHLQLFVRVDPDWSRSQRGLREMGYESHS